MSIWEEGVDRAATSRPFVHVGHRLGDVDALRARGAEVLAVVSIQPEGIAPLPPSAVPILSLTARTRSVSALQAEGLGRAVEAAAPAVRAFLDEHDPERAGTVVGALAAPMGVLAGRPRWLPDTALARSLEAKAPTGSPLGDLLPWIDGEPAPDDLDEAWWRSTTKRLGTDRLVGQRVGLSAAGEATWVCSTLDDLRAVAGRFAAVRVSPWREGEPVNVMAVVTAGGDVVVLPPSRQLVAPEGDGRPVYFGNVVGEPHVAGLDRMVDDARRVGAALADRGYVGMFGLDAIAGDRGLEYHDLNARLNGAILAFELRVPAVLGALLLSGWCGPELVAAAEAEVRAAVERAPVARWLLRTPVTRAGPTGPEPAAGLYRLEPDGPRAVLLDREPDGRAVAGDVVLVRPRGETAAHGIPGDRVAVANLWCDPQLSDALIAAHGPDVLERVVSALRYAARG